MVVLRLPITDDEPYNNGVTEEAKVEGGECDVYGFKCDIMSDVEFKELKYGFKYGDATIERHISDEKKGWVVLGLETSKHRLQIYVTKTGKVRIHDEDGKEWLPSNGG